jgi:AraC family transcriptional regulator, transcriptional activator of pobA
MSSIKSIPVISIKEASVHLNHFTDFTIGKHEEMGKAVLPTAHKHDFYLLLVIDEGSGTHSIDFQKYAVKNRMVFFLAPGQAHQWNLHEKTKGYQVMFSHEFLPIAPGRLPFFVSSSTPHLSLRSEELAALKRELEILKNDFDHQDVFAHELIRQRLHIVLTLLHRWYAKSEPLVISESTNRLMVRFFDLLEKNVYEENMVQFYAKQLHVTANYLNIVCKKEAGLSAGECIRRRVLLEAKRLLAMTQRDVKEISYDLGFQDAAYFSRFFKKHTGYTPRTFREKL